MITINNTKINKINFPDNTQCIKLDCNFLISPVNIEWKYETDEELFTLICLTNHIKEKMPGVSINLFLPYLANARMDRVKNDEDVFTLKYFCNILNSLHFDLVVVQDAHSPVALALIDNVLELNIDVNVKGAIDDEIAYWSKKGEENVEDNLAIFFPDMGAKKRYENLIGRFPTGYGEKDRCWETGEIRGLIIHNKEALKDKRILIVDDICSRGGTFYHSAKALKEIGVKSISLYITHCENTIAKGNIFNRDLVENIYTTRSLMHIPEVEERISYV